MKANVLSWPVRPYFTCQFLYCALHCLPHLLTVLQCCHRPFCWATPQILLAWFLHQEILCLFFPLPGLLRSLISSSLCSSVSPSLMTLFKTWNPALPEFLTPSLPSFLFLHCPYHLWTLIYWHSLSPKMNLSSMRTENFAFFIDVSLKPRWCLI